MLHIFYLCANYSELAKSGLRLVVSQGFGVAFIFLAVKRKSHIINYYITRPRPKAGSRVLNPARFVFVFVFFCGVANRHSWDADWSQIGNHETLIGSRALYSDHVLLLPLFLVGINGETRNFGFACQAGPLDLTLTQINLEMNCTAKNKCPESQKLDTRHRGENLNATSHVSRAAICIFLHSFSLIYSMWGKKSARKFYFYYEAKSFSVDCLCYYWNATNRWFDRTKTNNILSLIYNYIYNSNL